MKKSRNEKIDLIKDSKTKQKNFWSKVEIAENDDCWNWTGFTLKGYGIVKVTKDKHAYYLKAHNVAYALANPDENMDYNKNSLILHKCNNKACCNPSHLSMGTHRENMQDKRQFNEKQPSTIGIVLTEQNVIDIRTLYASGNFSQKTLAERFGISQYMCCQIVRGESWVNTGGPITIKSNHKPHLKKRSKIKTELDRALLVKDYAEGMTQIETSDKWNVSKTTVGKLYEKYKDTYKAIIQMHKIKEGEK